MGLGFRDVGYCALHQKLWGSTVNPMSHADIEENSSFPRGGEPQYLNPKPWKHEHEPGLTACPCRPPVFSKVLRRRLRALVGLFRV